MRTLAFLVALTALHPIAGASEQLKRSQQSITTAKLSSAAINDSCQAAHHTTATASLDCAAFELYMGGWTQATLLIDYTNSAADDVNLWWDGAIDTDRDGAPDLPWGTYQVGDGALTPTIKMGDEKVVWESVSDDTWLVTIRDINTPWVRFRFEGLSADASDVVSAWLVRRGP